MRRLALAPAIVATLLGSLPAAAAPKDPYLFSRPAHATLYDPDASVSADMDGDGRQDIVSAVGGGTATLSYGVSVLRATTDGFSPAAFTMLPGDPVDVAVADVDRDGNPDVVASVPAGEDARSAQIVPGIGGGLLGDAYEAPMSGYRTLTLGRFEPGITGAVVATASGLEYWKAFGSTFQLVRPISTDAVNEVFAADLDADGIDELLTADLDRVKLYRNLAPAGSIPFADVTSFTAADVNSDGRKEALATSYGGEVRALDASLGVVRSVPATSSAVAAAAGDLDEDGKADIVRANDLPSVTVVFGTGVRKEIPIAQTAMAVFIRDATGDGNADVLTAQRSSSIVEVIEGDGEGNLAPQRGTFFTNRAGFTTRSADFNNDGKMDVIAGELNLIIDGYTDPSTASVLLNDGKGGFTRAGTVSTQGSSTGLDVGDVNGDGNVDVVVSDYHSSSVSQYLGNGDGTFDDRMYLPGCALNDAVVVGNFNGDAYADVAAGCRGAIFQQTLAIYLGSPAGLAPGAKLGVTHSNLPFAMRVGDINGDRIQDILLDSNQSFKPCLPPCTSVISSSYDGPLTYFLGLGNGAFEPVARDYLVGKRIANSWLADVTADGRDDVLVSLYADDQVQVAPGRADGTLGTPFLVDVLEYPLAVRSGDLTGDGKVDLVATHGPTMISVTPGLGNGAFGAPAAYTLRAPAAEPLVRDFTGDGEVDVFAPFSSTGELLINGT
ncbi:MAG TPA: VCBS repeat-containing protein [Actinomycetota bacterium]|nr:VCBS repeat-containing protein [Actinomycetota bacterium]